MHKKTDFKKMKKVFKINFKFGIFGKTADFFHPPRRFESIKKSYMMRIRRETIKSILSELPKDFNPAIILNVYNTIAANYADCYNIVDNDVWAREGEISDCLSEGKKIETKIRKDAETLTNDIIKLEIGG
jgi:hypothetical protein